MIDWQRVDELKQSIGASIFDEVVVLFLEEADVFIARLTKASSATAMANDLHGLKGNALNLGFKELAELCHHSEIQIKAGGPDVDVDRIKSCFATSRSQFLSGLAGVAEQPDSVQSLRAGQP